MGRSLVLSSAVVLVAFLTSPAIEAQCFGPRVFASVGGGSSTDKVRIDPGGAENLGNEVGLLWQSADSTLGNNFGGGCPSAGWWRTVQGGPLRGIEGIIGVTACHANTCPSGDLTVVVQELDPAGDDAFFIAFRVDATVVPPRWWDLSRVDPRPSPSVLTLERFPPLTVFGVANLGGGSLGLDLEYADAAPNVHAVQGSGDTPLPASSVVVSHDLYTYVGTADPGRDVSAWTLVERRPYADGPTQSTTVITCTDTGDDVFLALGITFDGGAGADVPSRYVGASLRIDCLGPNVPVPAGTVPDGKFVPGAPLTIAKEDDGDITLSWAGSDCGNFDFAIYEGTLGDFASHAGRFCSTNSLSAFTLEPSEDSAYYLVVPISYQFIPVFQPSREGSYGRSSDGAARPRGAPACLPQWVVPCY